MHGLQQFVAFAETAKHGSFAAAARELGSAPSTLAKAVSRLETSLGVKLFHRTTRQVHLTPDGERLNARCERVLAEVDALRTDAAGASGQVSGLLRIDMPIVYGRQVIVPLLARLLVLHPRLQLDLRLQDAYVDLVKGGIDLAIRVGVLRDSTLVARRFASQPMCLVASAAWMAQRGQLPRSIEQLAGLPTIAFRMPGSGRRRPWQLRSRGKAVEIVPAARVVVDDGEAMVSAVTLGLGIAQLPEYMVRNQLDRGALVELLPSCRPPELPISAVYAGGRLLPPRVRVVLDALGALDPPRRASRAS